MMFFDAHTHHAYADRNAIVQHSLEMSAENYFSIGIHPWHAYTYDLNKEKLLLLIAQEKCVAIGETGLDKVCLIDFELQKRVFREHILLSESFQLPLILHCVRSWEESKKLFHQMDVKQRWIFHGFNKKGIFEDVLKNESIMISLGSRLLKNSSLDDMIALIPHDRLLLETDDSDIPIESIYIKAAELLNIPLEALKQQIHRNFAQTFIKWQPG